MIITVHPRFRRPGRVVTLLLLALVLADLNDADCDPIGVGPAASGIAPAEGETSDGCGAVCVPDCFCCSVLLPAPAAFVLERTRVESETVEPPSLAPAAGHTPLPEHIPIRPA